jgi:hypothetical protein
MPIAALHKDQKIFTAETQRRRENQEKAKARERGDGRERRENLLFSAAQTALAARAFGSRRSNRDRRVAPITSAASAFSDFGPLFFSASLRLGGVNSLRGAGVLCDHE